MKRFHTRAHGSRRFGIRDPHFLRPNGSYRGGIRL